MKKKFVAFVFSILFYTLSSCSTTDTLPKTPVVPSTEHPSLSIMEYFPLQEGAYWVYEGTVKWTKINPSEVAENEITWKMEVKQVIQRNGVIGYEMQGAPWDLAWYEDGKEPSEYGIIQTGGKFYQTPIETIQRLTDESDVLLGLVNEDQIFLEIPLIAGKKFCNTDSIARPDTMYCWNVLEEKQVELNVKGIDAEGTITEFTIARNTGPDYTLFSFVPRVGISRYQYIHHGTVSEADVRLVEFHLED
jgi:hypothetical protein